MKQTLRRLMERKVFERQRTEDGLGTRSVCVGRESCEFELVVDMDKLADEMKFQLMSGRDKATKANGCIVAKVIKKSRLEERPTP